MMPNRNPLNAPINDARLVVIDMQEVFRNPSSQWHVPGYELAAAQISTLTTHFGGNTVWTRFVRDPQEVGSWGDYYDRWSDCRYEADSAAWEITEALAPDGIVISVPTFSKWGTQLEAVTREAECLVVCGVATDCCVLATVLAAADAGKRVVVAGDACAGITPDAHGKALDLMRLLSPMVTVASTRHLIDKT